ALGALLLLGLASQPPAANAAIVTGYSGDAFAARSDQFSTVNVYGNTGNLPSGGGSFSATVGSVTDPFGNFSFSSGSAAASGGAGLANSSAQLRGLVLGRNFVTADAVTVTTQANASGVSANTVFTNLTIPGTSFVNFTGSVPVNTTFNVNVGQPPVLAVLT